MNSTPSPNNSLRLLTEIIAGAALIFASIFFTYRYYLSNTVEDVERYLKKAAAIEQEYIRNLPLYDDYANPEREQKLRTYLLQAHMAIAAKPGSLLIGDDNAITPLIKDGKLIMLSPGPDKLYYFYNVREKYRVLMPEAAGGLNLITERLQKVINARANLPKVKIALSSLIRPTSYQNDLRSSNSHATQVTSHSYGISFDIFYDDFFVSLPLPESSNAISAAILDRIRTKLGFMLGDALRRQFHAALFETLSQLQDEGVIYAILEKRQRCYHVSVLPRT